MSATGKPVGRKPAGETPAKPSAFGGFAPRHWVSLAPYGLGHQKPDHFGEMLHTAWQNRRALPYAWRILSQGVCDGCALGTTGLKDWTMSGVHLCTVRLNLLHLNTMGALDPGRLANVRALADRPGKALRALGRLRHPLVRRRGDAGFSRISWDEAIALAADRLAKVVARDPDRFACYVTSRGITNEVYYALQKATRALGTNNVDNSARLCHAPSTRVLKHMLGAFGSTCSYADWIASDLVVLVGSDIANNQPVTTKYLYYAKQRGARIVVVNPFEEPGLTRYWIPSVAESALFGTKLADHHFALDQGGDSAFFTGVLKALLESDAVDRAWIEAHGENFAEVEAQARAAAWDTLAVQAGASRADMERFAALYRAAEKVVFVWSMGITQHATGSSNVRALVNLALARGMIGKDGAGLMPIRGHSGVQGGSEVGCVPNGLPGNRALDDAGRAAMAALWGFAPPATRGLDARAMIDAAHDGSLDAFLIVGGNFLETLPDPAYVEAALARVPLRIHQDIVLTNQMLVEPVDLVLVFPARTRYEQDGGGTETTTERRIVYSPRIDGPDPGEARNEWEPLLEIVRRVRPELAPKLAYASAAEIRREIACAVPFYAGIERFAVQGDQVQYGGRHLCAGGIFDRPTGRARFETVTLDRPRRAAGSLQLTTRRGKQFNSMVHQAKDPLTGALRRDLLIAPEDLAARGLEDGDAVLARSALGSFAGRARAAAIAPGNVQGFWPEVNVLLPRDRYDEESGVPDFGTEVTIEPMPSREGS